MNTLSPFEIRPCGDSAVTIEFGTVIDAHLNACVLALDKALLDQSVLGIVETVPTYRSLLVHYEPTVLNFECLLQNIHDASKRVNMTTPSSKKRHWRVPVVYGGDFGIDLEVVAERTSQTGAQLISRHCAPCYQVYMVGFSAGFTYLGGLDPILESPRRDEPRLLTPAGSITIGGRQAAIQSLAGPTGWHLLGRTPVRSYHPDRDPMFLFSPGDVISFHPIPATDWNALEQLASDGEIVAEVISA